MLRIVCVQKGNYLGRGAEYVNILYDQITRNLKAGTEGEFSCFTDDPAGLHPNIVPRMLPDGLDGWWNKLWLFSPKLFPEGDQILFFDLDTLITGSLDELANWRGEFAILRDFYRPNGLQSSVMSWRSGFGHDIWRQFDLSGRPDVEGGDQAWIERVVREPFILQELFPHTFVSYKRHCHPFPPKGSRVVVFHGIPRPHECSGWVKNVWKVGGVGGTELEVIHNEQEEQIRANIKNALSLGLPEVTQIPPHDGTVCIVGGGPTATGFLPELAARKQNGQQIWALNGACKWLIENGITPDAHWILDARQFNARFVEPSVYLYASSQCHPDVFAAATGVTLYHDYQCGPMLPAGKMLIGGGTTVAMKALAAAHTMGYRSVHLFGIDCCVSDTHHAYSQPENDGEILLDVHANDRVFKAQPWMFQQAEDFQNIAAALAELGCKIYVRGDSLLAEVAKIMSQPKAADYRAHAILSRLDGPVEGVEIGVFGADLSVRLLQKPDLFLHMVDPWEGEGASYAEKEGDFHETLSQEQQDGYYEMSVGRTDFAADRRKIWRMRSTEAAKHFADESLDFVFIDGDHSYTGCKTDIDAWLPKVKKGGLLCGHDYHNLDVPFPGVDRAVDELPFLVEKGDNFTWFVRK